MASQYSGQGNNSDGTKFLFESINDELRKITKSMTDMQDRLRRIEASQAVALERDGSLSRPAGRRGIPVPGRAQGRDGHGHHVNPVRQDRRGYEETRNKYTPSRHYNIRDYGSNVDECNKPPKVSDSHIESQIRVCLNCFQRGHSMSECRNEEVDTRVGISKVMGEKKGTSTVMPSLTGVRIAGEMLSEELQHEDIGSDSTDLEIEEKGEQKEVTEPVKRENDRVEMGETIEIKVEVKDSYKNEEQVKDWEIKLLQSHMYVDPFDYLADPASNCTAQEWKILLFAETTYAYLD